ncbi:MAG: hypothetical protein JSW34_12940 [Candidatus Zixiibacteriota bacterium]|nr:MAG: hypothetical protein JSW34_12940 [candidate division Zixibacteria bacterium]
MPPSRADEKYDLNRIIIKPLYFGLVVNVLIPMGLLLICFYFENQRTWYNRIGDFANTLFYLFGLLSLAQTALAVWLRRKLLAAPMIRRKETFEDDLIQSLLKKTRPISYVIALIAAYGLVYFLLTGRFKETVALVVFSFLVFQIVRPRFGFIRKLIERQEALVEKGEFVRE